MVTWYEQDRRAAETADADDVVDLFTPAPRGPRSRIGAVAGVPEGSEDSANPVDRPGLRWKRDRRPAKGEGHQSRERRDALVSAGRGRLRHPRGGRSRFL